MDEEAERPQEYAQGIRKKRRSAEWLKNIKKKARNSKEAKVEPQISCNHANVSFCEADQLSAAEITGKIQISDLHVH